jgi:hypothetical protein
MIIRCAHKTVKIRKPHRCWGCGSKHNPGELMVRVTNFDDTITVSYWCEICDSYYKAYTEHFDEGISEGEFYGEEHYKDFRDNYLNFVKNGVPHS